MGEKTEFNFVFLNNSRRKIDMARLLVYKLQSTWMFIHTYRKFPKYSDTQKNFCNHSKIWTMWLYHRVMGPKDADGMANSVDPDQTGAVWSGSALFAQVYMSENLGSLRCMYVL